LQEVFHHTKCSRLEPRHALGVRRP
jgi:hypothetical protein